MTTADMTTKIGAVTLRNPVLTASGTFGYGVEYAPYFDISKLGGICTKGLSLAPRDGNPAPRIRETAAGMLNAIGLANIGVEAFCRDKLPVLRELGATVIANIFATSEADFAKLARRLDREAGVAAVEVNISCPNVSKGGSQFGVDPGAAAGVTAAVREATSLPVWVKLSPQAGDIVGVATACENAGADALCAINTISGMSIDIETQRFHLANRTGGLSGPAIKPIAIRMVWEISQAVKVPVIGMGGIVCVEDAVEFLLAGATAIQVGSASFRDPMIARKLVDELEDYCIEHDTSPNQLIGRVRPANGESSVGRG